MKTYEISTFRYGLDTRRDVLTSQNGTLVTLENGHINPGGEIEKRKAFVEAYDNSIFDASAVSVSITYAAGVATVTLANHTLSAGDWVKISGATQTAYNGEFVVASVGAGTFTYAPETAPAATPATGTPVLAFLGVMGLEDTSVGLTSFGSALANGSSASQGQPILEAAVPSGITYQQLKHPSISNDSTETYNRLYHRITKIVFSINYSGKALVCALFTDGRRFLYYDGSLIQHSANGLVMTGRTALADLANDLDRQLEAIGWLADANVDENGATENGSVIVKSPVADYFEALPSETSSAGQIGVKFVSKDVSPTSATLAYAGFLLGGATGTFQLAIYEDATATVLVADLTGGAVQGTGVISTTATKIAQAVNDFSYVHGYTALATTDHVWIYAAPDGDVTGTALSLKVDYSVVGEVLASTTTPTTIAVRAEQTDPTGSLTVPGPFTYTTPYSISGTVACMISGGTAPYTFAWTITSNPGQTMSIQSGATAQICTFRFTSPPPAGGTATIPKGTYPVGVASVRCQVTEAGGATGTLNAMIKLSLIVT